MRNRALALLVTVLAVSACGTTTKPKPPQREPIPDVRGMNVTDAAARLVDARYCVRLERGKPPANDTRPKPGTFTTRRRMPVERQSPSAGSTRPRWSMVTLTVGGVSAHATTYGVEVWKRGARIPCPPIGVTG